MLTTEKLGTGVKFEVRGLITDVPIAFVFACVQCDATWAALIYQSTGGLHMALLPTQGFGGVSTPHAPPGVAFYLDQATRCHSSGAHSAAITMFRSALEWLLEDQGFHQEMLGPKLRALEKEVQAGTAPKWTAELEREFMDVIKDLGNTAAHTNAGDLTRQNQIGGELYRAVETTFMELLDIIYEKPHRKQQRLADLKKPTV